MAKVPRNFRLLEELEKGEKGLGAGKLCISTYTNPPYSSHSLTDGCSYGLVDSDDIMMSNWNATILGPPHVSLPHIFYISLFRSYHLPSAQTLDCYIKLNFLRQSVHENRIYSLKIYCNDQYPDQPPAVSFISKINLPCVGSKGQVGLPCLGINTTLKVNRRTGRPIQATKSCTMEQRFYYGEDPGSAEGVSSLSNIFLRSTPLSNP